MFGTLQVLDRQTIISLFSSLALPVIYTILSKSQIDNYIKKLLSFERQLWIWPNRKLKHIVPNAVYVLLFSFFILADCSRVVHCSEKLLKVIEQDKDNSLWWAFSPYFCMSAKILVWLETWNIFCLDWFVVGIIARRIYWRPVTRTFVLWRDINDIIIAYFFMIQNLHFVWILQVFVDNIDFLKELE